MDFEHSIIRLDSTLILWLCLIGSLVMRAFIHRWKNPKIYAFMDSLPGPLQFPFIGSLHVLIGITMNNIYDKIRGIFGRYPRLFGFWMGQVPSIMTSDPEIFNAILGSSKNIDKFSHYIHFQAEYPGILSLQGDEWRKIRKMTNPSFCAGNFQIFENNFLHHTKTFLEKLSVRADGNELDIFLPLHLCTIDFVFDNFFNYRLDVQKKNLEYLSTKMNTFSSMAFERGFQPLLWPDFIYSILGKRKLLREQYSDSLQIIQNIIERRMEAKSNQVAENLEKEKSKDFIDILLNNFEAGMVTKDHLIAESFEMLVGGSLTNATIMSWSCKMLAVFPDIQERAYQEVLENSDGKLVVPDNLSSLVYLEMIVKETLRHFPIPLTGRRITEDLKVNDSLTIPAGVEVFLLIYKMHHDPEYWERPGEFYPEHFSEACEKGRPKGTFAPFLRGPRVCPGAKYAMRSMKLVLGNALLHYKFSTNEKPPKDILDLKCRLTLLPIPRSGFKVKVIQRHPV